MGWCFLIWSQTNISNRHSQWVLSAGLIPATPHLFPGSALLMGSVVPGEYRGLSTLMRSFLIVRCLVRRTQTHAAFLKHHTDRCTCKHICLQNKGVPSLQNILLREISICLLFNVEVRILCTSSDKVTTVNWMQAIESHTHAVNQPFLIGSKITCGSCIKHQTSN